MWVLDQTRLPRDEEWLELRDADAVAAAIRRLSIRGAPPMGVAAGYGVTLSVDELDSACETLIAARPTAANLRYAVERVRAAGAAGALDEPGRSMPRSRPPATRWARSAPTC